MKAWLSCWALPSQSRQPALALPKQQLPGTAAAMAALSPALSPTLLYPWLQRGWDIGAHETTHKAAIALSSTSRSSWPEPGFGCCKPFFPATELRPFLLPL